MLRVTKPCPLYNVEFEKAKNETETQMLVKYNNFFNYVSNHTGMEIQHISDVENIFNSLNIQVIILSSYIVKIYEYIYTYRTHTRMGRGVFDPQYRYNTCGPPNKLEIEFLCYMISFSMDSI